MKRALLSSLVALGVLVFGVPAYAQTPLPPERIEHFNTTALVHADASVEVVEKIEYVFADAEHHGIYRYIPVAYQTPLGRRTIKITNIAVADEKGVPYMFVTARDGNNVRVRIGDPNVAVSGTKKYVISYTVSRAIGYFGSYDEWYWNATGNQWAVPIMESSNIVTLPKPVPSAEVQATCYEGGVGSKTPCKIFGIAQANGTNDTITFSIDKPLAPKEGLTLALGFPKGTVAQPTMLENILAVLEDNWAAGLPVGVLIVLVVLWAKFGKDPVGRGTVVAEYDSPDALAPLQIDMVMKEKVSNDALSAEIVYLATQGYLKIEKVNEKILFFVHTDYTLTKLKEAAGLPAFDAALVSGLFKTGNVVKLSDLKNTFYQEISGIKKATVSSMVGLKYFPQDPAIVRGWYWGAGAVLVLLGFFLVNPAGIVTAASAVISGILVVLFSFVMPRVTKQGAVIRERIKGLKLYMDVAEKDRINFHNAPEKSPALFEKLLPFAMVLGVEVAWAKQFEGIYTTPPGWYNDPSGRMFNPVFFATDMRSFSAGAASTMASAPSGGSGSGGGGSSGGGFGGGGGGSW